MLEPEQQTLRAMERYSQIKLFMTRTQEKVGQKRLQLGTRAVGAQKRATQRPERESVANHAPDPVSAYLERLLDVPRS